VRRYVVARADELRPGTRIIRNVGGRSIGVFNVDGELYAIRNRCPHQGAELCRGRVLRPVLAPQPGVYVEQEGTRWLQCPWHGWDFDMTNGQSWFDPAKMRVRAYSVSVESGANLDAPPAERGMPDVPVPGPYTAEIYEVRVEDDYVVVAM
jgi:3-phenylpropionate/trans-cinnamate dioxygenase ferredoxin subunit